MKSVKNHLVKRIIGTVTIPGIAVLAALLVCHMKGVILFETEGSFILFLRATASVMLTTFALSLNLNSGRFDFSIGSVALLSSVISATICIHTGMPTAVMLLLSILSGGVLGMLSGLLYVRIKLPSIIVSLGVALFYEGLAFAITGGYGVSFVANEELTGFSRSPWNYMVVIFVTLIIFVFVMDYTEFGYEYKALVSGQKVAVHTGIREVKNAVGCYTIAGAFMGIVGFLSATNSGTIQMALNFGSIGTMFTAFLPMFIGGFIGRFCNEKAGYLLGAATTAIMSLTYARLMVDSSVQQIITALVLVVFLIYLNNENKIVSFFMIKNRRKKV